HCAKRPLLLAVPQENLAATIVTNHNSGVVVPPTDIEAFLAAATQLMNDTEMRNILGNNARSYAEERFSIDTILGDFEQLSL
ncbi:glycosyltransferase WbuB, partial [bacterium]|nr:glycosyltransferase WbuB [bacterium]